MNTNPPTKLSDALDLAATDVEECLGLPGVVINMGAWHEPYGKVCRMCAAGAVLHVRLGLSLDDDVLLHELPAGWRPVARAIDSMRSGNLETALFELAGEPEDRFFDHFAPEELARRIDDLEIKPYPNGPEEIREFCAKFRQAAEILRAEGF